MRDKIIELIKKYRAESEKHWTPEVQYSTRSNKQLSSAYDHFTDDLEKLLQSEKKMSEKLKEALRDTIINTSRIIKTTTQYDPAGSTYKIDWHDRVKRWAELCDLDLDKYDPFRYFK